MAPHSSTLAWKIPWMDEPSRLQSMGSLRVRHDWATSLSCIGEGNGNPLQCSCLEKPRDGGAWWAAIYRVAQSRTRLKWLSSSSSRLTLLDLWTKWTYECAWKLFGCGGLTLHQREPVSTTMVLRSCWFHQRNSISEILYTHEKSTDKDQEMNTWSSSSCSTSGVWSSMPWSWGPY